MSRKFSTAIIALMMMAMGLPGCNAGGGLSEELEPGTRAQTLPQNWKAVLSLGWDWSEGITSGTCRYDPAMQLGKVRLGADSTVYDLFDTDGNVVGTVQITGLKASGEYNRGNTTGDNSGVYPDPVLEHSAYKGNTVPEAELIVRLKEVDGPPPTSRVLYDFRLFINTKNAGLNISRAQYTLGFLIDEDIPECTQYIEYDLFLTDSYSICDNFTTTVDIRYKTRVFAPFVIRVKTDDPNNQLLLLNAIEIVKIVR